MVLGMLNVLEAFRTHAPRARVLVVTSSQIYGHPTTGEAIPEETPGTPQSIYAVTKQAADEAARLFAALHDLFVMTARPNNHIGPGQSTDFVVPSFAQQLLARADGSETGPMRVGNLESLRDFIDVRDIVRGYRLLLEKGEPGEAYNLGSGTLLKIQVLLDTLVEAVGVTPSLEVDPALYRPTDASPLLDISKIKHTTGWQPEIALSTTLSDIVEDLRSR